MIDETSLNTQVRLVCKQRLQHPAESATQLFSNKLFRVLGIEREKLDAAKYRNEALIACDEATIRVSWVDSIFVSRIHLGEIVSPRLGDVVASENECTTIARLVAYERPNVQANIFDLVPHAWVKDRALVHRAATLLSELPEPHRLLFNAIFWSSDRFELFCRQPSSMIGHHSEPNGNLRHTVEVAEEMRELCSTRSYANQSLGLLAALLHDAGKADEYVANGKGGWYMSERGKLLGHKVSAVEWIVEAVTRWNIKLPHGHYESLLHIMTAVPHAPDWMGLRQPMTPESMLLSMADRLSGHDDLMAQTVSKDGGFGRFHKHLKAAPFTVRG